MENKSHVFEQEVQILNHAKSVLNQKNFSADILEEELEYLTKNYEKLLADTRVITNISDRLQNKLNVANDQLNITNDKLTTTNEELHTTNEELNATNEKLNSTNALLQRTIDELVRAKVSKKATTIVFMAAILLFVISEVFLEPIVDKLFPNDYIINIVIKGSIALLLKPIDYLVESYLLRGAMRNSRKIKSYTVDV